MASPHVPSCREGSKPLMATFFSTMDIALAEESTESACEAVEEAKESTCECAAQAAETISESAEAIEDAVEAFTSEESLPETPEQIVEDAKDAFSEIVEDVKEAE